MPAFKDVMLPQREDGLSTETLAELEGVTLSRGALQELKGAFTYWSGKFAALHEEARQAIARHDAVAAQVEADMERRRLEAASRKL